MSHEEADNPSRNENVAGTFVHPTALVESKFVGEGSRIWAYAHIQSNARIGRNCNIGDHSFVETGAVMGDNVTLKNHVCVWEGISICDGAFIGPHVSFTNDLRPRSPRMAKARARYARKDRWLVKTVVEEGCSIGANATILAGLRLGRYSMIAAGAILTTDAEPHALMVGSPARQVGRVCACGHKLEQGPGHLVCPDCGELLRL
jgi:acetyltransferase-like isoleucine patch superfamily enzyme